MQVRRLTIPDVCDEIIDWIDAGKEVTQIIQNRNKGHVGRPAWVIKPVIHGLIFYVKVTIEDRGVPEELLIISVHLDR